MSRRAGLWTFGIAMVVLAVVLLRLDMRMQDSGGPGIIPFEVAASEERASEIKADWGEEGRDAARLSLWLDYPYLIAYGIFWTLVIAALRERARAGGWRRLGAAGAVAIALPAAAAGFDALEDVGLLLSLGGHGGDAAPLAGAIFAVLKFAALLGGTLYVLAGLAALLRERLALRARD